MQRLHVVGFTKDHDGLILSVRRGTRTGGYTVEVDANFEEVLAELIKERGGEAEPRIPRAESQLSVREMQQRLRSGQTIHQVARAAGVTDEWVGRFAVPIQAEQTQVIRQAFDFTFSKQRLGLSSQPLGVSVWWNLQDRSAGLDEELWEDGWSAFLVRDARWVVRFEYEARKRQQVAEWEIDLRARTLTSRNRLATELGYVESGRRRRPGPPPPVAGGLVTRAAPPAELPAPAPEPEPVAEVAPPERRPARRAAAAPKKAAPKKAAVKKAAVKKAAPKKAGARKAAVTRAPARPAAAKKAAARKAPGKRAAVKKASVKKAPAKKASPRRASAANKSSPRKTGAKKRAPKKAAPRKGIEPTRPIPSLSPATRSFNPPPAAPAPRPASSGRPTPVDKPVVAAVRAREAVPSERQPTITPPPAPSAQRRRLFGRR